MSKKKQHTAIRPKDTFYPKVSIVIPVYNGSKYLGEAIDSALAQTYKNIEIIVSNDGSNDNGATDRVAKSYGDKIIYLTKKENGGASTALNAAIKVMKGEYFSWLSHDDMYYPNKIERQVQELAKLKNKNTIILSDLDGINENRKKIYQTDYKKHIEAYTSRAKSYIHPVIYNQTHGCTLLIPKVCFDTEGLFNVEERVAQDFELFYRIFKKYPHRLVPEVLVTARDTSNRMGRRAKPRASLEYSRLYINIIENLSDSELALLARDKLALLSDMWWFFKGAGYIQAFDYANDQIMQLSSVFIKNNIENYLSGNDDKHFLVDNISRLNGQLSHIFNDNVKATDYMDGLMMESLNLRKTIKKDKISLLLPLREILLENGYKKSSALILKRMIISKDDRSSDKLINEIIVSNILGESKYLNNLKSAFSKKSKKPTIAFVSTHWLTGGMERVMSIVFGQIHDHYNIVLITPDDGREGDIKIPDDVNHIKYSNSIFLDNYDNALLSLVMILEVKVLVGFFNLYPKQLELYRLCKDVGIKTVASNHENFFYPYSNHGLLKVGLERSNVFNDVDAILWPTNFSAAVSGLANKNSYWMPNPNTFRIDNTEKSKTDNSIICVGRFDDYIKRIDRILQVFKLVQDKVPDSKLVVVGSCNRRKKFEKFNGLSVDDMIFELGIDEKNIDFIGNTPDVEEYYKKSKVLVMASDSEGFSMVINEGAAKGVPTVYNRIPGLDDLIVDGINGFVVEQGDIKGMADKVADILSDSMLFEKLSRNSKEYVKRFDEKIIGKKWILLLNALLSDKDNSKISNELSVKLGYTINDTDKFTRIVFSEFQDILKKVELPTGESEHEDLNRTYLGRLAISVAKEGKKRTVKKILKKVYIKAGLPIPAKNNHKH